MHLNVYGTKLQFPEEKEKSPPQLKNFSSAVSSQNKRMMAIMAVVALAMLMVALVALEKAAIRPSAP